MKKKIKQEKLCPTLNEIRENYKFAVNTSCDHEDNPLIIALVNKGFKVSLKQSYIQQVIVAEEG